MCQRNLGHASAGALLCHIDIPEVSRQSVCNWEFEIASALLVISQDWFKHRYMVADRLQAKLLSGHIVYHNAEVNPFFTYELISIVADATNTPACQSNKAHVVELQTMFGPTSLF